jgi:hypothetical protein
MRITQSSQGSVPVRELDEQHVTRQHWDMTAEQACGWGPSVYVVRPPALNPFILYWAFCSAMSAGKPSMWSNPARTVAGMFGNAQRRPLRLS